MRCDLALIIEIGEVFDKKKIKKRREIGEVEGAFASKG